MPENIGFISTRFAGTDGVSLESAKWAEIFWQDKHRSYWYGGMLDRESSVSMCVPEAYFGHPENEWISNQIWGRHTRPHDVTQRIHNLVEYLKGTLYDFVRRFNISVLVIQNALTIPMHLPLGVALTEFLSETQIPAIAHHHDFYWERTRFQVNNVPDFLDMAFPPRVPPSLQHVVINQAAREELALRKGISSMLVPNVFDFDEPAEPDDYSANMRHEMGLVPEDKLILQPTRVVPRKGIEHSIFLVKQLGDPRCKLIISHLPGDEGDDYPSQMKDLAHAEGVDLRFFGERIGDRRHINSEGKKIFVLHDLYSRADLVMYPSIYEGFGNALLESFYFKVPIVVNRYPVWVRDIEPKGFQVPMMNGFVDRKTVIEARRLLEDQKYREKMVEGNFKLASKYYGYPVLRYCLQVLINNIKYAT
jgi:glycosyltransferase involved in cell wall biosynthesis